MRVNKRDTKISKKYRGIRHGGRSVTSDHGNKVSILTVKKARSRYAIRLDDYYSYFKKRPARISAKNMTS